MALWDLGHQSLQVALGELEPQTQGAWLSE